MGVQDAHLVDHGSKSNRKVTTTVSSGEIIDRQAMSAHHENHLNDGGFSLGQPECPLSLSLLCLHALFIAIVGLGEGSSQFTHQLLKALVAHRHMGQGGFSSRDFSGVYALICKWHRGRREEAQGTTRVFQINGSPETHLRDAHRFFTSISNSTYAAIRVSRFMKTGSRSGA
ncbi:hypothetical protein [Hydrogenophaga sp. RWCD_12]|uniref:hypothetical protein n=1 Tax=Hydrogenophaga sp. RWCD_12 TaxID=3391190 RepID=UPI00398471C5